MENPAAERKNTGKPRYSLVDYKSLEPMVRVLEFGATKYSANNWRKGGSEMTKLKILDCMQRHVGELIDAINEGKEELDWESKQHIIGHIMCNAMFYSYHHINKSKDDKI